MSRFPHPKIPSRRGSALALVLILTSALAVVIYAAVRATLAESRMNERHFLNVRAQNAAESVVDAGTAQLIQRWFLQTNFSSDELNPGQKPLVLSDLVKRFLIEGGVQADTMELHGGVVPNHQMFFVDPDDPRNFNDPNRGQRVLARNIEIYGRATGEHPSVGTSSAYAVQTLQLRDAPLFSYSIFYGMDMELTPGPRMDVYGPVYAAGDLWLAAVDGLYFHGVVSTASDFRVGFKTAPYDARDDGFSNWNGFRNSHRADHLYFKDRNNQWVTPYHGANNNNARRLERNTFSSQFFADDRATWRDFAINRWGGNVLTQEHGVHTLKPLGFEDYVQQESATDARQNHGYALIEPPMPIGHPAHKGIGEEEKFSRKANFIVEVIPPGDAVPDHAVRLRRRPSPDAGWSSATRNWLADPDAVPPPEVFDSEFHVAFYKYERVDESNPFSDLKVDTQSVSVTDPETGELVSVQHTAPRRVALLPADFESDDGLALRAAFDEMMAVNAVDPSAPKVVHGQLQTGMVDQRLNSADTTAIADEAWLNIVELNTTALARMIEMDGYNPFTNFVPEKDYNGQVYFQFPSSNLPAHDPEARADRVVRGVDNHALMLTQAGGRINSLPEDLRRQRVPNPAFNEAEGRSPGFTLATNAPLYTRGHVNADGDMATPANSGAAMFGSDDPANPDPPVALAADSITILSNNWRFADSQQNQQWGFSRRAESTEFNAAIITGLVPTNHQGDSSYFSGGAHNLPRFLENWRDGTFRYRGSMVALFESEVQNTNFSTNYFHPPNRQWGFFSEFEAGNYPPGTPNVRTYRRVDFRFLTKAEYDARLAKLPWQ